MIISKRYAKQMIGKGKMEEMGRCFSEGENKTYIICQNWSMQRTDHYLLGSGDLTDKQEKEGNYE